MKCFYRKVNIVIALLIFCMTLIACMSEEVRQLRNNAIKLKTVVEYWEAKQEANIGIRYLLDASCSHCIGDYFRFLSVYENSGICTSCEVYMDKTYWELLEYYMEVNDIDPSKNIKNIALEFEYPFGFDNTDGVVLIIDSQDNILETIRF